MESAIIYLDIVFLINLGMDYAVLWATARFAGLHTSSARLLAASLVGALFAVLTFLPQASTFLNSWSKFFFSMLLVVLAFKKLTWRSFLLSIGYCYLVAFVMAGAMLGGVYFFNSRSVSASGVGSLFFFLGNVSYTWLLAAVGAALLLGRWGGVALRKNFWKNILHVPIVIRFGDQQIPVRALVDTGNQLKDPFTGRPVLIVEYGVIGKLLPPEAQAAFKSEQEPDLEELAKGLYRSPWASRIRLIPYTSIGKSRGLLLGLRPDEVVVVTEHRPVRIRGVMVGVYQRTLSPEGDYQALLHPDILHSAIG